MLVRLEIHAVMFIPQAGWLALGKIEAYAGPWPPPPLRDVCPLSTLHGIAKAAVLTYSPFIIPHGNTETIRVIMYDCPGQGRDQYSCPRVAHMRAHKSQNIATVLYDTASVGREEKGKKGMGTSGDFGYLCEKKKTLTTEDLQKSRQYY